MCRSGFFEILQDYFLGMERQKPQKHCQIFWKDQYLRLRLQMMFLIKPPKNGFKDRQDLKIRNSENIFCRIFDWQAQTT